MKHITLINVLLAVSLTAFAHDGGHGPKLTDSGKYGGIVTSVIRKSEANKGDRAELLYKAELARSSEGTVRLYIYDKDMKPIDLNLFEPKGSVQVGAKVKGKWQNTSFLIERKDSAFVGRMPTPAAKPFHLDVTLKTAGTEVLIAFENLD